MTPNAFTGSKEFIEQYERDLRSLVEIPSVAEYTGGLHPYGEECAKVLDKAIEIAEGYGFATENHEYHCGSVIYGEGNREIGIIGHLDVVPAGTGWNYEPYKLTVDKDLFIGRGSEDDKGPLLMGLYTMRYFKENNVKLPFALRLIMGCDEEVGSTDLSYYKKVRKPPSFSFTPDAAFPVCIGEKSIMHISVCLGDADKSITSLAAGTVVNAVPGEATAVIDGVEYNAVGATAHGSTPEVGVNAISLLADKLLKADAVPELNKKAFEFLKTAGEDYHGNSLGIAFSEPLIGPLTCTASKLGIKDGKIILYFDIRFPASRPYSQVFDIIKESLGKNGFSIESENSASSFSQGYLKSPETPEISALTKACSDVLGYHCEPYTMGGGTYARLMPGAVAFGARIDGYTEFLGEGRGKAHDRDEYLSIEEVRKGTEIFIRSIMNLAEAYGDSE